MWVCLGTDGRVLEYFTEDGYAARAGTTNFKIIITMAGEGGIDFLKYGSAAIKLYRPDLNNSALLNFPLERKPNVEFTDPTPNAQSNFVNGRTYNCYVVDFNSFELEDEVVTVLNMPGTWHAIATLFGTNGVSSNVVGSITFEVQDGNVNDSIQSVSQEVEMTINEIMRQLAFYSSSIQEITVASTDTFTEISAKAHGLNFFAFTNPEDGLKLYAYFAGTTSFVAFNAQAYKAGAITDATTFAEWNSGNEYESYVLRSEVSTTATAGKIVRRDDNGNVVANGLSMSGNVVDFGTDDAGEAYLTFNGERIAFSYDNVIDISSNESAVLTEEQQVKLNNGCSILKTTAFGSYIYYLRWTENSTYIYFYRIDTSVTHNVIDLKREYFRITKSDYSYLLSSQEYITYNKTSLDTQLADKASITYVDNKVAEFAQNEMQVVSELPTTGEEGIIYLLPIDPTDLTKGYYRYIWEEIDGTYQWLSLGTTEIDLSDYYTESEINTLLSAKQDTLVSGTNIKTINGTSLLGDGDYAFDDALNNSSTNAAQTKVVYEELKNVREVAEGKTKSYVIHNNITLADIKDCINNYDGHAYDINGNDISQDIINGNYDNEYILNTLFQSTEAEISQTVPPPHRGYIVIYFEKCEDPGDFGQKPVLVDTYQTIKRGDIIYVYELNVPDRWFVNREDSSRPKFAALEAKANLDNYYTKSESDAKFVDLTSSQTITGDKDFYYGFGFVADNYDYDCSIYINPSNYDNAEMIFNLNHGGKYYYMSAGSFYAGSNTDLGKSSNKWRDLYLSRNLTDGTNSISVANIVAKQNALVSGVNINTINGTSILGSGNYTFDDEFSEISTNALQNKVISKEIRELNYELAIIREELFEVVLTELDYEVEWATLYAIPNSLTDTAGTHRVVYSETQLKEIEFNSVVVNELINRNSTLTYDVAGDGSNHNFGQLQNLFNSSHKYLLIVNAIITSGEFKVRYPMQESLNNGLNYFLISTFNDTKLGYQGKAEEGQRATITIYDILVDLTQWFGSNSLIPADLLADATKAPLYGITSDLTPNTGVLKSTTTTGIQTKDSSDNILGTISIPETSGKSAGSVHDYIEVVEGDIVEGEQLYNLVKHTLVGLQNLGVLNWTKKTSSSAYGGYYFSATLSTAKAGWHSNVLCTKYESIVGLNSTKDKTVSINAQKLVVIQDSSYSDEATFKTAMNGVYLYYELDTPTQTTIATGLHFNEVSAIVEQGGTINVLYTDVSPNITTRFVVKKAEGE